jgi:hypothetical protein
MESLVQKTIEFLLVDVTDLLTPPLNLTDLAGTNPVYDVIDFNNAFKYTQEPASQDGTNLMRVYCLVNTNLGGLWDPGEYRLYVTITTPPEQPRLGPFTFKVEAE